MQPAGTVHDGALLAGHPVDDVVRSQVGPSHFNVDVALGQTAVPGDCDGRTPGRHPHLPAPVERGTQHRDRAAERAGSHTCLVGARKRVGPWRQPDHAPIEDGATKAVT